MIEKKLLLNISVCVFIAASLCGYYLKFMHHANELPLSVVREGINVIDEIKDVKIPGYKIFNPGVIDLGDSFLVAYRERESDIIDLRKNIIKVTELDSEFCSITKPQQLIPRKDDYLTKVSDPRLFSHNGEIYIIFCDNSNLLDLPGGNIGVQMLAKLIKGKDKWEIENLVELKFPGASEFYEKKIVQENTEKNWTPFSLDGKLYTVYLLEPEKIVLEIDIESGACDIVSRTKNDFIDKFAPLRGGTPPVFDKELDEFISIYHIAYPGTKNRRFFSEGKRPVYIAGAYCFTKDSPFKVTNKTAGPFYQQELYNSKKKIVFPTGLVRKGDDYLMFYGEDDINIKVAIINRDKLLSQMYRSED